MTQRAPRNPMRLLRWLNAGFLVLAACRALVPGLCATQTAALESAEREATMHPCCQVRMAEAAHDDRPSIAALPPEHAACGFCALSHGMIETLDTCRALPPAEMASSALTLPVRVPSLTVVQTHRGRAPPILG